MAQNEVISASLEADAVPTNRECVKNLTEILQGIEDFVKIVGLASAAGTPLPTNNVAAQALATATSALTIATTLQANAKQRRSGVKTSLANGSTTGAISWSPVMPSTDYEVRVTFYGDNSGAAAYSFHVVNGTEGIGSVTLRFIDIPANFFFNWVVEQI